jgi:hypothetical protein
MANAIYPKWKEALLQGLTSPVSALTNTVKVALVDTGTYTYSSSHDFLDDISGVVGTAQTLAGTKSYTSGKFSVTGSVTFTAVTGASVEALIFYIDTGSAATSRLVAYLDTSQTGLPVTPNGGDITVNFDQSGGIFTL